jgi:AcrR family transcriptional regulator
MSEVEEWLAELLKLQDEDDKITEKQVKILQAAVEIFSEKGYAATSTSEIAQKAGVAEGTIFRHYKTKKELLLSIVAPMMTKLIAPFVLRDFHKVLDAPYAKFEDFLRAVIVNRMEFVRKNLPILKILVQEIPFHPELKEQFVEQVGKKVLDRFTRVAEHFQKKGDLIDLPSVTMIRLAASTVAGFLVSRFLIAPDLAWDDEKEIEITIHFIMYGLTPRS